MTAGALGPVWIGVVIAATITALVTALGWVVAHARELAADARRRREKVVDVQKALRAEIAAYLAQIDQDLAQKGGYRERLELLERTLRDDADFRPIVAREKHDTVFEAMVGDIHLLPTEAVEPVVVYYSKIASLTAFIDDLRSGPLRDLPADRRLAAFRDLVALKLQARDDGRRARAALDRGIAAAADPRRWISTRAADRGGPESASAASGRRASRRS